VVILARQRTPDDIIPGECRHSVMGGQSLRHRFLPGSRRTNDEDARDPRRTRAWFRDEDAQELRLEVMRVRPLPGVITLDAEDFRSVGGGRVLHPKVILVQVEIIGRVLGLEFLG